MCLATCITRKNQTFAKCTNKHNYFSKELEEKKDWGAGAGRYRTIYRAIYRAIYPNETSGETSGDISHDILPDNAQIISYDIKLHTSKIFRLIFYRKISRYRKISFSSG